MKPITLSLVKRETPTTLSGEVTLQHLTNQPQYFKIISPHIILFIIWGVDLLIFFGSVYIHFLIYIFSGQWLQFLVLEYNLQMGNYTA